MRAKRTSFPFTGTVEAVEAKRTSFPFTGTVEAVIGAVVGVVV